MAALLLQVHSACAHLDGCGVLLQALGVALEEQLHLLLPALMRLVAASGGGTPLEIKRTVLRSMKRLLPRMHLAGFSSAVLQPLMKVGCKAL